MPERQQQRSPMAGNSSSQARNLSKSSLGGVIFGCTPSTKGECLSKQLFGMPAPHFSYVKNIEPGLPLFLFDYINKKLYGIYEAASHGQKHIDPYAWTQDGKQKTAFPAQVRIRIRTQCQPLVYEQYYEIIKDNYYSDQHLWFELDHEQAKGLIMLFRPLPTPGRTIPSPYSRKTELFPLSPSNRTKRNINPGYPNAGYDKQKWDSKPSGGLTRAKKYEPLPGDQVDNGDGSSSKMGEDISRTLDMNLEMISEGENQQHLHPNYCPQLDGDSQTWHGMPAKMFSHAPEKMETKHMEPSCSDSSEKNMHDSRSGSFRYWNGEGQTFSEQQPDVDGFKTVLQKLKELSVDRDCTVPFPSIVPIPYTDFSRGKPEKVRLPNNSSDLVVENKTPTNEATDNCEAPTNEAIDDCEESRLKESFLQDGKQVKNNTDNQFNVYTELVQVVIELKEKANTLEKKQVDTELEMQQLRNAVKDSGEIIEELKIHVKELESKLSLLGDTSDFTKQYLGSEKVLYLIGGFDGTSWLSSVDSFSPTTGILKSLVPMSSVHSYASAASLNGNLYVYGGGDGYGSWFDTVECYSPRDNYWTSCPRLNRSKGSLAGAASNGKIFAIGGGDGHESFSDVEMFDPAFGSWVNIKPMLEKRFATTAAELNGALYAVGGYDEIRYLQSAERCDPREGYWNMLPSMKIGRGCHSLAVLNEKIYAIGGFDGERMVSSTEIFDPRLNTWVMGEPLHYARGYSAAAVLYDSIFIIGGLKDGNFILDNVECYKEGSGWTEWALPGFDAIGKRSFLSAVVL